MPGFTTHYLFGTQICRGLTPGLLKNSIDNHYSAYCLGLQGPDLFFYYPIAHLKKKNIGSLMHKKHSAKLFQFMLEYRDSLSDPLDQEILAAYIAGFLGHYTLDSIFHPYVYSRTGYQVGKKHGNDYYGQHVELESCLDILFLKKLRQQSPEQFRQSKTICLPRKDQSVITRLLSSLSRNIYQQTYSPFSMYLAISCMRLGTAFFHDSSGLKKKAFSSLEMHLYGYHWMSPMIQVSHKMNETTILNENHQEWTNPWKPSLRSNESAEELFQKASSRFSKTLMLLEDTFLPIAGAKARLQKNIGNRSFHSGKEQTRSNSSTILMC